MQGADGAEGADRTEAEGVEVRAQKGVPRDAGACMILYGPNLIGGYTPKNPTYINYIGTLVMRAK